MPAHVLTSRYLQTNATVLRAGGEALVVDAPYFPDELAALPRLTGDADVWLLATHSHYDHLMGRLAFPKAPMVAGEDTVAALRREPERAARELAAEDARTYVRRDGELTLWPLEPIGVPGETLLDVQLVPATGHTGDGCAAWWPDERVLCCGDYLSDVEIPLLSWAGSLPAYEATLDRLEPLLGEARLVVPGHGAPADGDEARRRLDEDRAYLQGVRQAGPEAPLPPGRDTSRQREIHRSNLERHGPPA